MDKDMFVNLTTEMEIRRRAAEVRAIYLRELFDALGHRIRAAFTGRKDRKNGRKFDKHVGGAAA
jgi:hypothetical protein